MRKVVLFALLLLVPPAAGQHDHAMGSGYAVATDIGPSGLAHVGSPVHFEFIAFGDDLVPDFHQDLPFRITLDNVTLYEATTLSGHDYDGVHGMDIVFPHAGHWRAEALADGEVVAYREGTVAATPLREATVTIEQIPTGLIVDIVDAQGQRINHTDVWLAFSQAGRAVLRTHLHIHDGPVTLQTGYLAQGALDVEATAYSAFPTSSGSIRPVTATTRLTAATPGLPGAPVAPAAAKNAAVVTTGDFHLIGTYDPFTIVGPDTLQHLNVLVVDPATGMPVQHVDFDASLRGPAGLVFASSDLHEYDGIYTVEARQALPGQYVLDVTASRGAWSADIQLSYIVAPPAQANLIGPQIVTLQHDAFTAGSAGLLTWTVANLAGLPFAHGEIDMQVRDATGRVLVRDKLHTHGDGTFPVHIGFPAAGTYRLDIEPFPLDAQPTGPYYKDALGAALDFTADVAPGAQTGALSVDEDAPPVQAVPSPGPAVALLALLGLALLASRKP